LNKITPLPPWSIDGVRRRRGCPIQDNRISSRMVLDMVQDFVKGVLRWPDNNSMFRRLSCNRATSKE
jgi:hypothetical protein